MEAIMAAMPRIGGGRHRGGGTGEGVVGLGVNLARLNQYAKTVKTKTSQGTTYLLKGRRTGLVIDGRQVAKDSDGLDNIDSFWASAELATASENAISTPGTAQKSTPGSLVAADSPISAVSSAGLWAGRGSMGGQGGGGEDEDGEEEDGSGELGANVSKRLDFPPARLSECISLAPSRDDISTDEEGIDNVVPDADVESSRPSLPNPRTPVVALDKVSSPMAMEKALDTAMKSPLGSAGISSSRKGKGKGKGKGKAKVVESNGVVEDGAVAEVSASASASTRSHLKVSRREVGGEDESGNGEKSKEKGGVDGLTAGDEGSRGDDGLLLVLKDAMRKVSCCSV
ncbi:unnamed protein product [Choristocarpus tenellus]